MAYSASMRRLVYLAAILVLATCSAEALDETARDAGDAAADAVGRSAAPRHAEQPPDAPALGPDGADQVSAEARPGGADAQYQ